MDKEKTVEQNYGVTLKTCPFCKFDVNQEQMIDTLYPIDQAKTVWGLHCADGIGGCTASVLGWSPEEAIANWNRRDG